MKDLSFVRRILGYSAFAPLLFLAVAGQAAPPAGQTAASAKPMAPSLQSAFQASIEKQQKSLKQQRHSLIQQTGLDPAEDDFIAPLPLQVQADCAPLPASYVETLIQDAARKQALDPGLLRAVMRQESGFHPCAVSVKGALGLMQLMPATAAQLRISDPFDPAQNVEGGARFLKQLLDRYHGDLRLALVAYNAGTLKADGAPEEFYPAETQTYLANIFAELYGGNDQTDLDERSEPASDTSGEESPSAKPSFAEDNARRRLPQPGPVRPERNLEALPSGLPPAAQ
jgi:soluble lytic murein transglycosylase-like protein